jgi:CDGSH-type Zn-finger protein
VLYIVEDKITDKVIKKLKKFAIVLTLPIINVGRLIMTKPVRASDTPFAVEVEEGKKYSWCSCGKSEKQPFCDGSHKGSEFSPVRFIATESKKVYFCGCKQTASQPFCDGSHK